MPPSVSSTELLIVPTAHLSATTPEASVARARHRLMSWRPDLVAIEALPGSLVVEYEQRGGTFADVQVGGAVDARRGASLVDSSPSDVWSARREACSPGGSTTDRVLAWLRVREPINALLLPYEEADLADPVREFLDELAGRHRETVSIGAHIARELGHDHVAHVDDHAGVENIDPLPDGLEMELRDYGREISGLLEDAVAPPHLASDLWAQWRFYASDAVRTTTERLESSERLSGGENTPHLRRVMLANWRARNLAIAARLRAASAAVPGGRVLFVVGSSHEMPLRTALGTAQYDLRLVDLEELEP
ncbi:DUF5694 domain-containing protein [Brachybacterium alimentarium]|uniref:DUF5694 domain-containing protein n=1 Tax=Brachybacterium alimentarium TaxID=47845 RepID=UPI0031DD294D